MPRATTTSLPPAAAELYVGAATGDIGSDTPVAMDGQRRVRVAKTPATHIDAAALALESREGDRVMDPAILVPCDLVAIRQGILAKVTVRRGMAVRFTSTIMTTARPRGPFRWLFSPKKREADAT